MSIEVVAAVAGLLSALAAVIATALQAVAERRQAKQSRDLAFHALDHFTRALPHDERLRIQTEVTLQELAGVTTADYATDRDVKANVDDAVARMTEWLGDNPPRTFG